MAHQILNCYWYQTLFKVPWTFRHILLVVINFLLLFDTLILLVSATSLAGEVVSFLPWTMPWWGREWHTQASEWALILVSFHLGLHGSFYWKAISKLLGRGYLAFILIIWAISGYFLFKSDRWQAWWPLEGSKPILENLLSFCVDELTLFIFFSFMARFLLEVEGKGFFRRTL
ncbi:MAG: hypothetical protein IJU40_00550 [Desulfovibrionaceae bacterium]|nr:hypothetical protein [Desulfovibrionaceae bacterium]